ncbi:MAG: nucleotide-binding domain containing protein, partial [Dehalococcoidia bacterium]
AETDSDLQAVANCSVSYSDHILVGSAGLAYALGSLFRRDIEPFALNIRTNSPFVIVAGSRHQATKSQVESLASAGAAEVISVSPEPVLGKREERVVYSRQVMADLHRILSDGRNAVLAWEELDRPQDSDSQEDATVLSNFAGLIVYGIARKMSLGGLMIAGGDTAFGVLRALGASTVDVSSEIEHGAPLGVIGDGVGAGLTIVTKAGGFGDEEFFVRTLEAIRESG